MVSNVVLLLAILITVVFVLALVIGLAIAVIGFQLWKATRGKTTALSQVRHGEQNFSRHVRSPKAFNGDAQTFKEWAFCVELALHANDISNGASQTDFASSHLEGNALLWYLSCMDSGRVFSDWKSFKAGLAESFGPLNAEEENRLSLFSLTQEGPLDGYIREFSRLSLNVSDLDQHSRALLFVRGLSDSLRHDAMREHPKTLSEAIRAARSARQNVLHASGSRHGYRNRRTLATEGAERTQRRSKLGDEERAKLLRKGRCFKCRNVGHLYKDCPENSDPNATRQ